MVAMTNHTTPSRRWVRSAPGGSLPPLPGLRAVLSSTDDPPVPFGPLPEGCVWRLVEGVESPDYRMLQLS